MQPATRSVKAQGLDREDVSKFLPGEQLVSTVENSVLHSTDKGLVSGYIYVTNYALCYRTVALHSGESNKSTGQWLFAQEGGIKRIPVGLISHEEKIGGKKTPGAYGTQLQCKDMRVERFFFDRSASSRTKIHAALRRVMSPSDPAQMFCFALAAEVKRAREELKSTPGLFDNPANDKERMLKAIVEYGPLEGWSVFDPHADFQRMGVGTNANANADADANVNANAAGREERAARPWRVSQANADHALSPTYPRVLGVPEAISDEQLQLCAQYRTRSRLPVLVWRSVANGAVMCRSSQPRVGLRMRESEDDQQLLHHISLSNSLGSACLVITDCRPPVNAMANMVKGGGFEGQDEITQLHFLHIENIHVMRDSLFKLLQSLDALHTHASPANPLPSPANGANNELSDMGESDGNVEDDVFSVPLPSAPARLAAQSLPMGAAEARANPPKKHSIRIFQGAFRSAGANTMLTPQHGGDVPLVVGKDKGRKVSGEKEGWNLLDDAGGKGGSRNSDPELERSRSRLASLIPQRRGTNRFVAQPSPRTAAMQGLMGGSNAYTPQSGVWHASKWLTHIRVCLGGAVFVAKAVGSRGVSVLVHCSDGWDRTTQITSLAQIFLDPYYRTLRGFCELIEKDWCAFGHKFGDRVALGKAPDDQYSPIFLQFLDCVYQTIAQYPLSFEFTDALLIAVADHLFANTFGTFLFNSQQEREQHALAQSTESLWTFVLATADQYKSPHFNKGGQSGEMLTPSSERVGFWANFFMRHHKAYYREDDAQRDADNQYVARIEELREALNKAHEQNDALARHLSEMTGANAHQRQEITTLRRENNELRRELGRDERVYEPDKAEAKGQERAGEGEGEEEDDEEAEARAAGLLGKSPSAGGGDPGNVSEVSESEISGSEREADEVAPHRAGVGEEVL